jgi:hypothetical protein
VNRFPSQIIHTFIGTSFNLKTPTKAYFDKHPSFPNDVPAAELLRLSFAKLLGDEKNESDALFEACRAMGFLLEFEGCPEGETFLKRVENLFSIHDEVNTMEVDKLMKYADQLPHSLFG